MGTTVFLSNKGCLPLRIFTYPSILKTGTVAFCSMASEALAKIKSSKVIIFWFWAIVSICWEAWALKSASIRLISSCSFRLSSFS